MLITKTYPPMTSLPYLGLVVLPLRTPGRIWQEGFPTSPCILVLRVQRWHEISIEIRQKVVLSINGMIASFDAMVIAAYAHFDSCRGANEENADSRLFVEPSETFDVTTVMSSSSTTKSLTGDNI
jgi:hypothetical protein